MKEKYWMKPQLENCIRKRERLKIMSNLISVLIYIAVGFLPGHLNGIEQRLQNHAKPLQEEPSLSKKKREKELKAKNK